MGPKPRPSPDKEFRLRAQDWDKPLLDPTKIAEKLEALQTGQPLTGVVLCSKEQAEIIRAMVLGCSKQYAISIVVLDAEGTERVPGLVQDQLQFRRAKTGFLKSDAQQAVPRVMGAKETFAVVRKPSAVL